MSQPRILIQLDADRHASAFDAVVAIDAGVEQLLQYAAVRREDVRNLVYGAMFTRGPAELHRTALFIGGSDVAAGEQLLAEARDCFFCPMWVSILMDANGANTTAAAAVLAAARHAPLKGLEALVLAGTGPVGQRIARLLARQGARVHISSRQAARAQEVCQRLQEALPQAHLSAVALADVADVVPTVQAVFAAGAAGVKLLSQDVWKSAGGLRVLVDANAVPPLGIEGLEATDKGKERAGVQCYGALGIGGWKMKIHRAAVQQLFTRNDLVLDADEVFAVGEEIVGS
jgi:methylenetetrahydrofolate/methylenetetrahydromethanopterin dehydrogenase (NADP+)